jgi:hypothetical protein
MITWFGVRMTANVVALTAAVERLATASVAATTAREPRHGADVRRTDRSATMCDGHSRDWRAGGE